MSHKTLAALVTWLLLPLLAGAQPAGDATGESSWYAQALTRGEGGLNVTQFWSRGAKLRAETVVAGHKIVTIVNGDRYYAYDALSGRGLSLRREPATVARDRERARPFGEEYWILQRQGAEKIREEPVLDRTAGVYRVTDGLGRRELWVTEDEVRIPLRVEIFDRRSGDRRTTDYVNWQSDFTIPEHFFRPDPNTVLEEMDHIEYVRRSAEEGTVGPVPVFYTHLLFTR